MLFLLHFEMLVTEELIDRLLINSGLVVVDDWRQIEDELPGLFSFLCLFLCRCLFVGQVMSDHQSDQTWGQIRGEGSLVAHQ